MVHWIPNAGGHSPAVVRTSDYTYALVRYSRGASLMLGTANVRRTQSHLHELQIAILELTSDGRAFQGTLCCATLNLFLSSERDFVTSLAGSGGNVENTFSSRRVG